MTRLHSSILLLSLVACSAAPAPPPEDAFKEIAGTRLLLSVDADLGKQKSFFDQPYPSDLRLDATGHIDLRGLPNHASNEVVTSFRDVAMQAKGFPVIPVAWFRFDAPIAAHDSETVIAASPQSPTLLVDCDASSEENGRLFPTVAQTLRADDYLPENVLAVAPRPGFVLKPHRRYGFVVLRALNDAAGAPLGVPAALAKLLSGKVPEGTRGQALADLDAPLWPALQKAGVDLAAVAGATVFTTGDVVADLSAIGDGLLKKHSVEITGLAIDPTDGASHERYCELQGKVLYPQFQKGTPPFDTDGLFEFGADGLPVRQRDEEARVVVNIPKTPMPASGFPLMVYFHGSGGEFDEVVDVGRLSKVNGQDVIELGKGPAHVLGVHGIATAGSGLPVNPERLKGAGETAYLNLKNVPAFRDTFRQGAIEQRMFLTALTRLAIAPALVSACGMAAPAGGAFRFDASKLLAQGQSMGGMYANIIGATEPRYRAVVPTGAGGFWSYFILKTSVVPGARDLLGVLLGTTQPLTFLHPAMHALETAVEPADPLVYMPRLAARPLPGHPARPVYAPVGKGDRYFPTEIYDAAALAYGSQQAGNEVWPTMQPALTLDGRGGLAAYPVKNNRTTHTGVVAQYLGDGVFDPHAIYRQLDEVKFQYGCFFSTFLETGIAVVPAPAPLGSACPK